MQPADEVRDPAARRLSRLEAVAALVDDLNGEADAALSNGDIDAAQQIATAVVALLNSGALGAQGFTFSSR